jgi:hypothetical protein
MAITSVSTIYPPIMDTYMPAFNRELGCKVYFTLSSLTDIDDINEYIQVTVKYQYNNQSALNKSDYPLEIAFKKYHTDDNGYYIYITPSDLQKGEFYINNFYKIQMRFMIKNMPSDSDISGLQENTNTYKVTGTTSNINSASWLNTYSSNFSEWSKVCLIKGIDEPIFTFKNFDIDNNKEIVLNNASFTQVIGTMNFNSNNSNKAVEKEYLKSYSLIIEENSTKETIYESGTVYTDASNPNEINYNILYMFDNYTHYNMYFYYTTNNGYSNTLKMKFYISSSFTSNDIFKDFGCELEPNEARTLLTLDLGNLANTDTMFSEENSTQKAGIVFRRSSNKDNFKYWEDVKIIYEDELLSIINTISSSSRIYKWYDYTIESGVIYQYGVQKMNRKGQRTTLRKCKNSDGTVAMIMCDMNDMYLTTMDKQLKISLNPNISSITPTVSEGKTETLGSKYPYYYRSGKTDYKVFSISGTISHLMDDNYVFFNKENFSFKSNKEDIKDSVDGGISNIISDLNRKKVYGDYYDLYSQYNSNMNITDYNDYIFEKYFRDSVIDFLKDGEPKLFRSSTEGNMIVVLSGISFTPNKSLSRLIYDFNATVYEIDECNFDNYVYYNLHSIESLEQSLEDIETVNTIDTDLIRIGELDFTTKNITQDLQTKLKLKYGSAKNPHQKTIYLEGTAHKYNYYFNKIEWVRIYFSDTVYSIYNDSEHSVLTDSVPALLIAKDSEGEYQVIDSSEVRNYKNCILGFLIKLNGKQLVVNKTGIFTLNSEDVSISNINFSDMKNYDINVKLQYKITLTRKIVDSAETKVDKYYYYFKASQLWREFDSKTDIINILKNKHTYTTTSVVQKLVKISKMYIEADSGAVIKVDGKKTIMNNTGQLELDNVSDITSLSFDGYILRQRTNQFLNLRLNEFYINPNSYNSIDEIDTSVLNNNNVYNINGEYKIYFKGSWEDFTLEDNYGKVETSVDAMINYVYEIERGNL